MVLVLLTRIRFNTQRAELPIMDTEFNTYSYYFLNLCSNTFGERKIQKEKHWLQVHFSSITILFPLTCWLQAFFFGIWMWWFEAYCVSLMVWATRGSVPSSSWSCSYLRRVSWSPTPLPVLREFCYPTIPRLPYGWA